MFKKLKKNQKGFTLVELVVVIAILAVLAALLVPRIMGNVDKATEQKEITNARTLAEEITVYNAQEKVENGSAAVLIAPAGALVEGDLAGTDLATTYTGDNFPDSTVVEVHVDADGNASIVIVP